MLAWLRFCLEPDDPARFVDDGESASLKCKPIEEPTLRREDDDGRDDSGLVGVTPAGATLWLRMSRAARRSLHRVAWVGT